MSSRVRLARNLAGGDDETEVDDLVHHFTVALHLLQSLEPVGVGARDLAECLSLQLKVMDPQDEEAQAVRDVALAICKRWGGSA